ncbi:MAG: hypothetical protein KME16_10370 [Scytolyngbya sp. HA4215-MV1]|nr:hypothetical protein [Scytolyngbya sp. HA4215-MV1]
MLDQSTTSQHTCPCCGYTLLRHMRLGGLFWHCRHCYEVMPAWAYLKSVGRSLSVKTG